jgi:hypothetical protein
MDTPPSTVTAAKKMNPDGGKMPENTNVRPRSRYMRFITIIL